MRGISKFTILLLVSLGLSIAAFAQQDTVYLKNGDRIIGVIKELSVGVLTLKPKYSSRSFSIDWKNVQNLGSLSSFIVTTRSGARLLVNFLGLTSDSVQVDVLEIIIKPNKSGPVLDIGPATIAKDRLVFVEQRGNGPWERLDGEISVGANLAKANRLRQYSVRSQVDYSGRLLESAINFNAIRSFQNNTNAIRRTDGGLTLLVFLRNEWFVIARANFLSNTEQLIDLRSNYKLGLGRYLVLKPKTKLSTQLGLNFNREKFSTEVPTNESTELVLGISLTLMNLGNFTVQGNLLGYGGISEAGRFRSDSHLDVKYTFLNDFFLKVGATVNYDTDPTQGASTYDYIIQSTLGWSF
ncbi:DUF481 domain-containing protein [Algoriphagus namhaensis]